VLIDHFDSATRVIASSVRKADSAEFPNRILHEETTTKRFYALVDATSVAEKLRKINTTEHTTPEAGREKQKPATT